MALVTICKYRRAKTPYFLEQAGLNMYSLEELAWFLYHNICLAEPQMFDDRLCRWLEEEIGSSELARRIRNGKESGTNFQNLVISIVGAVDLFTNQELAELGEQLKSLGTMQEQERLKLRADGLLNSRNEWAAAEEYRRILRMHQNTRLGVEFYAAVWNNLGICYVRQFLFERAVECFETSMQFAPHEDTRKYRSWQNSWQQENVRETERKRAHRSLMTRILRKNCFAGKKITEVVKKLVDNYRSACYNSFIFDCFTMVEW